MVLDRADMAAIELDRTAFHGINGLRHGRGGLQASKKAAGIAPGGVDEPH